MFRQKIGGCFWERAARHSAPCESRHLSVRAAAEGQPRFGWGRARSAGDSAAALIVNRYWSRRRGFLLDAEPRRPSAPWLLRSSPRLITC